MIKNKLGDISKFAVPFLILFAVVFGLVYAFPLLGNMSGVSSNMSIALGSVGTEVSSALTFIAVILILGLSVHLKGRF